LLSLKNSWGVHWRDGKSTHNFGRKFWWKESTKKV